MLIRMGSLAYEWLVFGFFSHLDLENVKTFLKLKLKLIYETINI